jgi:hypothetical protein
MRSIFRPIAVALSVGCLALLLAAVTATGAFAQAKPAAPAAQDAPPPEPPLKQIVLTDKQIEGVLNSQKDLDAATEKLPENPGGKPDPKVVAQLDGIAKKYGFADYTEYNVVVENIGLVMSGIDPQSKKYVGTEAVIKQQIAAVDADKKMSAKDKKDALADLNEQLKDPGPAVENKGNIDLIGKYYDKLAAAMSDDQ